jgi:L-ascorbate metabolism protein UlaG (beta-lactamase superfamily)
MMLLVKIEHEPIMQFSVWRSARRKIIMNKRSILFVALSIPVAAAAVWGCLLSVSNGPSEDAMTKAKNYSNGRFTNSEATTVMKPGTTWDSTYRFLFEKGKDREPSGPLPLAAVKHFEEKAAPSGILFAWLGHAGVFLEIAGKRVLVDPMFSERASFFSWAGPRRFQPSPIQAKDLPALDAVLISHDHYDHLDKRSVLDLVKKTSSFHVPRGVGAILERWGVPKPKIREYAWWDEQVVGGLTIAAVPARHFSGRGLFDRDKTLWCSWVVISGNQRVYHSGDTGMTSQFREIGEKYGPFDVAFIKIAAYHENWPDIHLNPEQAIEAFGSLRGRIMVPIHWGTFSLSTHSWHEPIERLVKAADRNKAKIITPMMGEIVDPSSYENRYWWRQIMGQSEEHP